MFSSCNECGGEDSRLMCWPHVSRNLDPQLRRIRAVNNNLATKLEKDIEDCQWGSESRESFLASSSLLRDKYLELETDVATKKALNDFFDYLSSTWIDSSESGWFEGAHPYGSSNNQVRHYSIVFKFSFHLK